MLAGGIVVVVDIFKSIVEDLQTPINLQYESTCHPALSTLRNVSCASEYNAAILGKTAICKLLVDFLHFDLKSVYTKSNVLNEIALLVISNLACYKSLSVQLLSQEVCITVIVSALGTPPSVDGEDAEVFEAALWAVRTLSGNSDEARRNFLSSGILELLASKWHVVRSQHHELVCGALYNLVKGETEACEIAFNVDLSKMVRIIVIILVDSSFYFKVFR
jgi:hypothetical protein